MSKRSFRIASIIVTCTFLAVLGTGVYFYRITQSYPNLPHGGDGTEIAVEIPRGASFIKIANQLTQAGVINKPDWFRYYGMYRGDDSKVHSGEYTFTNNDTPKEVLDKLIKGTKAVTARITIPPGLHMLEVFALYEEQGISKDVGALEVLGRDPEFLRKHGIDGDTIEGYLFPDTYDFRAPSPPELILTKMIKQHRIVWDKIRRANETTMAQVRSKLAWSERDFLIMASIVEKEAASASERPRIAQVFMNRLSSPKFVPHRLDTDPTIRYGCMVPKRKSAACQAWEQGGRLFRKQLNDADNPYNTYQHEGLPPGPICSPGAAAFESVMAPDGSNYFFFVAKDPKTHAFARTRAEHERNVDKYIRNK